MSGTHERRTGRTGGKDRKIVAFYFEPGVSADVTIRVRHPGDPSRAGVRTQTIYESPDDPLYTSFFGVIAEAANQVLKGNFADGKDASDTPPSLNDALDALRLKAQELYHNQGSRKAFQIFGRVKGELFRTADEIRNLNPADDIRLTEILRWHIQEGINTPPVENKPRMPPQAKKK